MPSSFLPAKHWLGGIPFAHLGDLLIMHAGVCPPGIRFYGMSRNA